MCGRFVLNTDIQRILVSFHAVLESDRELQPRFNIAPTQETPVIVSDRTGSRSVHWMQWGLVPSWARDRSIGSRMINARAESVLEKPSFQQPFRRTRCLVPATGFYEWKANGGQKIPQFIEPIDQPLFAMAGIWDSWPMRDASGRTVGETLKTFSILTIEAAPELREIHDRMPRILSGEDIETWLDPNADSDQLAVLARTPWSSLRFRHRPVSKAVNSPRNDSPALLDPAEDDQETLSFDFTKG